MTRQDWQTLRTNCVDPLRQWVVMRHLGHSSGFIWNLNQELPWPTNEVVLCRFVRAEDWDGIWRQYSELTSPPWDCEVPW